MRLRTSTAMAANDSADTDRTMYINDTSDPSSGVDSTPIIWHNATDGVFTVR